MPSDDILANMNIESPEGEAMVQDIIDKARQIASDEAQTVEEVADNITDDLEEAGLDTSENEEAIETIVEDVAN